MVCAAAGSKPTGHCSQARHPLPAFACSYAGGLILVIIVLFALGVLATRAEPALNVLGRWAPGRVAAWLAWAAAVQRILWHCRLPQTEALLLCASKPLVQPAVQHNLLAAKSSA